ncbi:MAG: ATP-binding protein [Bacteroidales bacterium]
MKSKHSTSGQEYSINKRIDILRSVHIFSDSPEDILSEIASGLEEIEVQKNEVVFHKGDLLHAMYIIVEGSVKVHDGEYIFARFHKKEYFGEYALIDASARSASVTAMETTRLLRLDKNIFEKILDKNPHIARAILRALIQRLRHSNILEEKLTQRSYELKLEKEDIEKQKLNLEELNATKDKFFSIIAHDLKNPFNSVIGLSELLLYRYDSYDDAKIKEFIEQIHTFSSNAYNLLDNLLQWARSQTGRLKHKPADLNAEELIRENMNLLQDAADRKNIELTSDVNNSIHCYADPNMVKTIIRNLISNAIKFTNENGKVYLTAEKEQGNKVKFSVVDNGVGIPEDKVDQIFDLTSHYSREGTNSEKGTGLGLILCKEFVEKNGGEIWVESEEGKGSTFNFTLPEKANNSMD